MDRGYAAQEAAAAADARTKLRAALCKHTEDALFFAESRRFAMAQEIEKNEAEKAAAKEKEEAEAEKESEKHYLLITKDEDEDGPKLDLAGVKAAFGKYDVVGEPEELRGPNETRDGAVFKVELKSAEEADRAVAEQKYVPVICMLPPEPPEEEAAADAALELVEPGFEKPVTPILWLAGHSSMDGEIAKKMFTAMDEYQKEELRALGAIPGEGLDLLDQYAEPLMTDKTNNEKKDDIMDSKETTDEQKEDLLTDLIMEKISVGQPKNVEPAKDLDGKELIGVVACELEDMEAVHHAKRQFKKLRVPAEDPHIEKDGQFVLAERFTVTLDDVAGPLFGLQILHMKQHGWWKDQPSLHTERDPESVKEVVYADKDGNTEVEMDGKKVQVNSSTPGATRISPCDECAACREEDPEFKDHKCQEGVCREGPRADKTADPVFNCFVKYKCMDKFGQPRLRLGMLCEKCAKCTKCKVATLWDLPGPEPEPEPEPEAPEAAAEGEDTVSYLIRVRTGVKTSDLGRGVTPATDAAITVVIYGQDGETEPLRLDHWVGVVRECVCASLPFLCQFCQDTLLQFPPMACLD